MTAVLASFPSPAESVWYLGPVPIRAYALCIVVGIVVAVLIGNRRWVARGGVAGEVTDMALWAVPFGIVGARIYHVLTSWEQYFGPGGSPGDAIKVWEGGLGIWGGIAGGALGAWVFARRRGIRLLPIGDAVAPGIVVAQAIGRFGNYFNQELYGRPTDLPWAVEIDPGNRPPGSPDVATYHPTFLYESLWNLGVAGVLVWADRRFRLGHGRVFFLYVALYCLGRVWIEMLRVDPANTVLGLRLNVWTSIVVGVAALAALVATRGERFRRETPEELYRRPRVAEPTSDGGAAAGR